MSSNRRARILFAAVLLPAMAVGMQPKMPEQLLCESTNIVIARVVKAAQDPQCFEPGRRQADCSPEYGGPLTIQVQEVLGQDRSDPSFPSHRKLKRGDVIVVWTVVHNDSAREPSAIAFLEKGPTPAESYVYLNPPTGLALSDQDLKRLLIGHSFIFGIYADDRSEPPFHAYMWRTKFRKWVNRTIGGNPAYGYYCPRSPTAERAE